MSEPRTRREVMEAFLPTSPLPVHLGIRLVALELDRAELAMAWDARLTTLADVVHGGAIAALIDTAGMAVTWSDDTIPDAVAGSTATMHVDYVAAARGRDLTAVARTVRRGRTLCFSEVEVREPDTRLVARGSVLQVLG